MTARPADAARGRREAAAAKYKPAMVELLLVAEAPPAALERYFYFEEVHEQDALFRYVVRALLATEPTRDKAQQLDGLSRRGVFLIDLKLDPKIPGENLAAFVPALVGRAVALDPQRVITIKANVCDLAQDPLREAGLNVAHARVPFPGSGQQRRFLRIMSDALAEVGWTAPVF